MYKNSRCWHCVQGQRQVMVTTGADDNSMNLWKPKAFSDTREILFTKRKGLTGMMGSKAEILEAIGF